MVFLIKRKLTSEDVINERVPSNQRDSSPLDSSDENYIAPVGNKCVRLLSSIVMIALNKLLFCNSC